jgi:hypothetical protein
MRRGSQEQLVFNELGNLVAIATGSDFYGEHSNYRKLMASLSNHVDVETAILAALRNGEQPEFPNLLETKRIVKFPERLLFDVKDGEVPEATLSFVPHYPFLRDSEEVLSFREGKGMDPNISCAWMWDKFAIHVRGEKYVKALTDFNEALRAGKVAFSDAYLPRKRQYPAGIVFVDVTLMSDDDKAAAVEAQAQWESELRLEASKVA